MPIGHSLKVLDIIKLIDIIIVNFAFSIENDEKVLDKRLIEGFFFTLRN